MTVTFFYGKPRSGKTLHMIMNLYHDWQKKRKIYSNLDLKFPHTKLDIYDVLNIATMEMDIEPKSLGIQEASKWFDSHRAHSKENTALTALTGQSGKREIDILYDDQFANRIDNGLRYITDYTIVCHREPPHPEKPIYFQYLLFEGFPTEKNFRYTGKSYTIPEVFMSQFYTLYNTREPTQSLIMRKQEHGRIEEGKSKKQKKKEHVYY